MSFFLELKKTSKHIETTGLNFRKIRPYKWSRKDIFDDHVCVIPALGEKEIRKRKYELIAEVDKIDEEIRRLDDQYRIEQHKADVFSFLHMDLYQDMCTDLLELYKILEQHGNVPLVEGKSLEEDLDLFSDWPTPRGNDDVKPEDVNLLETPKLVVMESLAHLMPGLSTQADLCLNKANLGEVSNENTEIAVLVTPKLEMMLPTFQSSKSNVPVCKEVSNEKIVKVIQGTPILELVLSTAHSSKSKIPVLRNSTLKTPTLNMVPSTKNKVKNGTHEIPKLEKSSSLQPRKLNFLNIDD